jgi:hypothetical protein
MKYVAKDRSGVLELFEEPSLAAIKEKIYPNGQVFSKPEPEALETTYWFHPESNSALVVEGKPDDDVLANCNEMTLDEYNEFIEIEKAKSEASDSDNDENQGEG